MQDKDKLLKDFPILCGDGVDAHANSVRYGIKWSFGLDAIGALVDTRSEDLLYRWTVIRVRQLDGPDTYTIHSTQCEGTLGTSTLAGRCKKCQESSSDLDLRMRDASIAL